MNWLTPNEKPMRGQSAEIRGLTLICGCIGLGKRQYHWRFENWKIATLLSACKAQVLKPNLLSCLLHDRRRRSGSCSSFELHQRMFQELYRCCQDTTGQYLCRWHKNKRGGWEARQQWLKVMSIAQRRPSCLSAFNQLLSKIHSTFAAQLGHERLQGKLNG